MIGYGKEYEMLYAGSNDDFMNFRPQYLLYARQFQDAFDNRASLSQWVVLMVTFKMVYLNLNQTLPHIFVNI